jgi:hypothetical protein
MKWNISSHHVNPKELPSIGVLNLACSHHKILQYNRIICFNIGMTDKTPALHAVSSQIQCKSVLARARQLAGIK